MGEGQLASHNPLSWFLCSSLCLSMTMTMTMTMTIEWLWAKLLYWYDCVIWCWCPQKYWSEVVKNNSTDFRMSEQEEYWIQSRQYQIWTSSSAMLFSRNMLCKKMGNMDKSGHTNTAAPHERSDHLSSLAAAARWRGGDGCSFPVAPKVRARWISSELCNAWGFSNPPPVIARILGQTTAEK